MKNWTVIAGKKRILIQSFDTKEEAKAALPNLRQMFPLLAEFKVVVRKPVYYTL